MKRLPSIKPKLVAGTYVRVLDLRPSDSLAATKSEYVNNVYAVGAKDDKYPDSNLIVNTRTEYKKQAGYYSGPVTNINTGISSYVGSAVVEELEVKDPKGDKILEGTQIILLAVPGRTSTLGGKLATVGSGGLIQNFQYKPDTYGGNVIVNGVVERLAGMRVTVVQVPHTGKDSVCQHGSCGKAGWMGLDVCEEHALHAIHGMSVPCAETSCNILAETHNGSCTKHGGRNVEVKHYKVDNKGSVYASLGLVVGDTMSWPSDELRKATIVDNWGTWRPAEAMVGELVWKGHNKTTDSEVLILKVDAGVNGIKHFAIDAKGVSLTADPAVAAKKAEEKAALEKIKVEVLEKADTFKRMVEELFKDKEKKDEAPAKPAAKPDEKAEVAVANNTGPSGSAEAAKVDSTVTKEIAIEVAKVAVAAAAYSAVQVSEATLVKPQEAKMSKIQELKELAKNDGSEAGVRIARKQFVKATREPLVAFLASNLGDDSPATRKKIADFIESELGESLVSMMLSVGLGAIPGKMGENPFVKKLTRELRLNAETEAGDVLADLLMKPLRQVASFYAATLGEVEKEEETVAPALEVITQTKVPVDLVVEQPEVVGAGGRSGSNR